MYKLKCWCKMTIRFVVHEYRSRLFTAKQMRLLSFSCLYLLLALMKNRSNSDTYYLINITFWNRLIERHAITAMCTSSSVLLPRRQSDKQCPILPLYLVGEAETDCWISLQISLIILKRVRLVLPFSCLEDINLPFFSLAYADIMICQRVSTLLISCTG